MIGQITKVFGETAVNISNMTNQARGEHAYTLLDLDQPASKEALAKLAAIEGIRRVRVVK